MEIFISLQANLKERISYAALVTTFLGIWRNYIILHPGLNLKENFITRETFQDVLLSCHFSVMLIGIFPEKYSYLECPLHLTGTDAVEIYFSQNGSFVLNKHTYTILDMKRNLSAMNRLNQIQATNPNIAFRKAHSKQDNIWIKQHSEEERPRLLQEIKAKLRDYPTKEEIIERWRFGCEMARELSREIGIDKDPSAGDDDSFFHSPFSFKPFRHGFEEMSCESELEDINQTNTEDNTLGYDIENGTVTTDDCDDPLMPDDLNHAILNECNLQLEDLQLAQELYTEADTNKDQSKIYIPELKAYKYKSQVVSELVNNGKVSSDRLTRVRQGASSSGSNSSSTGVECNDKYSVGLFDFLAVRSDDDKEFFLGRVIRITRRSLTNSQCI